MTQRVHTISVQFSDGGSFYSYLSDLDFEAEDYAVVESPHNGLVVVKVKAVKEDVRDGKAYKWIVDKVDVAGHYQRQENAKRAEYLKTRLQTMKKQVEEEAVWALLAERNPEAAALLQELKTLQS